MSDNSRTVHDGEVGKEGALVTSSSDGLALLPCFLSIVHEKELIITHRGCKGGRSGKVGIKRLVNFL